MLANLKKNFCTADLERTAALIRAADIPTMWFFIFGGPGENEETVNETFEFIDKRVNPQDMAYLAAGIRIYPNTELHTIALAEGSVKKGDSLLRPVFYVSPEIGREKIGSMIRDASRKMHNCIPASESTPPPDMLRTAMELRQKGNLQEPMFRTLMRIRREEMIKKNTI
jgi:hypothetical protein